MSGTPTATGFTDCHLQRQPGRQLRLRHAGFRFRHDRHHQFAECHRVRPARHSLIEAHGVRRHRSVQLSPLANGHAAHRADLQCQRFDHRHADANRQRSRSRSRWPTTPPTTAQSNVNINIATGPIGISGESTANGTVATAALTPYQANAPAAVLRPYNYSITSRFAARRPDPEHLDRPDHGHARGCGQRDSASVTLTATDAANNTANDWSSRLDHRPGRLPSVTWLISAAIPDNTILFQHPGSMPRQPVRSKPTASARRLRLHAVFRDIHVHPRSADPFRPVHPATDTTDYTTASAQVTLTVNQPGAPVFTTQPTAQSVVAFTTATFTAAATASPTPSYLWQVSSNSRRNRASPISATATAFPVRPPPP